MSHIESVSVVITDLEAVKAACARLGAQFIEGKTNYVWFGWSVGDYPLPEGMTKEELGHCAHVIRVPGVSYEVGLVKLKDKAGYKLAYDFYGTATQGGGLKSKFCNPGSTKMEKLVDAYSIEVLKRQAARRGYRAVESVVNGKLQLQVVVR
jgi:hypothetical protein